MKRVQVNSKTARTDVYLKFPQVEPNKTYTLSIEKLLVPALESMNINTELFRIERRISETDNIPDNSLPQIETEHTIFTPRNLRTLTDLVYDMNRFFREFLRRIVTKDLSDTNAINQITQYVVPASFQQQNTDWYTGNLANIEQHLQAIFRSDGRIGIKMSPDAMSLFVLRFSETGQRIFNTNEYLAVDVGGTFDTTPFVETNLVVLPHQREVLFNLPDPMVTESLIKFMDNSVFSHISYRRELVLQTTLPLNNTVECDQNASFYKRQLASYTFPDTNFKVSYDGGLFRTMRDTRQTLYSFEDTILTHNSFRLKGTDLQNFSIFLVDRSYTWDETYNKYIQKELPFELYHDTFYTVQFAVKLAK